MFFFISTAFISTAEPQICQKISTAAQNDKHHPEPQIQKKKLQQQKSSTISFIYTLVVFVLLQEHLI